ncbi:glycoside hydrolase family 32 protein [Streptomyces cellulosae]|uniref:beta-fructofuranosidase n=1 Tax=Streptomyces cellulosae TaxID=1968 RepID=A0ABW7YKX2_STRCE
MSTPPADPHLPAVHLRPPRNWINDPNGLVFHDGHYHVFFQYNPHGPQHANIHWGHFRSRDLVTWEQLPVALAPTPGGDDADGCFSGNAVSLDGRLVAFYSANRTGRWWQPVTTAESHDGGHTWTKRPELLIPQPPAHTTMYRDPYVWQQDGRWRMLVGSALADGRGAAQLYESTDLDNWQHRGPFAADAPRPLPGGTDTGVGWECPQYAFWPTPDGAGRQGLLIVSTWDTDAGPQATAAYPGRETPDGTFHSSAPVRLDHGPDFYAPALLRAPDGRWLLWAWSWEAREPTWAREAGWAGLLTLPREITLAADGTVHQRPAREVAGLRDEQLLYATGRAQADPAALGDVGTTFDLTARLTPSPGRPGGLRLVTSADGSEHLDVTVDTVAGDVVVDRSHASRDPRAVGGTYRIPCPAARPGAPVELRIVVDGSVLELFLSTGEALTLRLYPVSRAPWSLQARAVDFTVQAWSLAAPEGPVRGTAAQDAPHAHPPIPAEGAPCPEPPVPAADFSRP